MKGTATILLIITIFFTACAKTSQIPTVSGTINGAPALTLYGASGKPTDYVLLSKNASVKEVSYQGQVYNYYYISTGSDIFITVSATTTVRGALTTSGSMTILTINNNPATIFTSTEYASR